MIPALNHNCISGYSNVGLGARLNFLTDPTITGSTEDPQNPSSWTTIKAAHINELRTAINAVRSLAGLPAVTTPNPAPGTDSIFAFNLNDLRTDLNDALVALNIQTSSYTNDPIIGSTQDLVHATPIKAVHIRELRQRATSGIGNDSSGGSGSSFQIHWLVTDQLGTPRMIFDQTGSLSGVSRHDYLPFGEELTTQGGRSPQLGYVGDSTRQKFTQKERDDETGLDYFLARYYSSNQGRFTSPDEFAGGPVEVFARTGDSKKQAIPYADVTQPQSLNKYTYVYNEPCRYTDPDGHCGTPSGLQPGQTGICVASYIASKWVWTRWVPSPGRGDGRDTNGQGGTSRVEVRVIVDAKGNVKKTDEKMGSSGFLIKDAGPQGSGGSDVSSGNKDEKGNIYFQIHQLGTSNTPAGLIGSIENHLNIVVTPDQKVGITPSSTAKDYPSLEVYKYTMDAKGNVTTTLIRNKTESGDVGDLAHKEKPIKADPQ